MARAHPQLALRPYPAGGRAAARGDLPRQHRGTDRRRLQRGAAGGLGCARPTTRRRSRERLGKQLTLVAHDRRLAGRLRLARRAASTIDMLYVHPAVAGQGVGTMLLDALEKLAAARGAQSSPSMSATPRSDFFEQARLHRAAAQHRAARRRMARQHHDGKERWPPEGDDRMKRPETPFPRHWLYYIVLKHRRARRSPSRWRCTISDFW